MTDAEKTLIPQIAVIPATLEQESILANLLHLYAHDFSEFHNVDLGADGRFVYADLPLYWSDPDRHPFLIRVGGKLAGFVLVKSSEVSGKIAVWDMAEFFVVRRYRRHRVGTIIAHQVWRRFPGRWEIRVLDSNLSGHQFWERAISLFREEAVPSMRVEKAGKRWRVFSFES